MDTFRIQEKSKCALNLTKVPNYFSVKLFNLLYSNSAVTLN